MRLDMDLTYTDYHKTNEGDDLPLKNSATTYVGKVEIMEELEQYITSILNMMARGDTLTISIHVKPGTQE